MSISIYLWTFLEAKKGSANGNGCPLAESVVVQKGVDYLTMIFRPFSITMPL